METSKALLARPRKIKRTAVGRKPWTRLSMRNIRLNKARAPRMISLIEKRSFAQPVGNEKRTGANAYEAVTTPISQPLNPFFKKWRGMRKKTALTASLWQKLRRWILRGEDMAFPKEDN